MTAFEMQYQSPFADHYSVLQQADKATQVIQYYDCDKCTSTFTNKSALKHHETLHNIVYECIWPECSNRFTSRADFKKHMDAHSSEKFFPCAYCAKSFDNRERYQRHLKEHIEKPLSACTRCPAKFDQKALLRHHEKEHSRVKIVPVHLYKPVSTGNSDVVEITKTVDKTLKNIKRILCIQSPIEPLKKRVRTFPNTENGSSNQSENESESLSTSDSDSEGQRIQTKLPGTVTYKKSVRFAPDTKGDEVQSTCEPSTAPITAAPSLQSILRRSTSLSKQYLCERPFISEIDGPSSHSIQSTPKRSTSRCRRHPTRRSSTPHIQQGLYFTRSIKRFQDEIGISLQEPFGERNLDVSHSTLVSCAGNPTSGKLANIRKFFKCQNCLYSSYQLVAYTRHMVIHNVGRKGSFSCPVCEAKFGNKGAMKIHMKCSH